VKYSELLVWQKAMDLVAVIYEISRTFPDSEKFGLASQVRCAAVSVPANVAEGHGRKSTGAYIQHISIANGSLMEVETLIQIACRLGYVDEKKLNQILAQTDEIGKMLSGLQRSLNPRSSILNPA
jgi:four helix bundle protein